MDVRGLFVHFDCGTAPRLISHARVWKLRTPLFRPQPIRQSKVVHIAQILISSKWGKLRFHRHFERVGLGGCTTKQKLRALSDAPKWTSSYKLHASVRVVLLLISLRIICCMRFSLSLGLTSYVQCASHITFAFQLLHAAYQYGKPIVFACKPAY